MPDGSGRGKRLRRARSRRAAARRPPCCPAPRRPRRSRVLRVTDEVTRPPSDSTSSRAASRVSEGSVPVRTNVLPASGWGPSSVDAALGEIDAQAAEIRRGRVDWSRRRRTSAPTRAMVGADAVRSGPARLGGGGEALQDAEARRQQPRDALADEADAERVQQASEAARRASRRWRSARFCADFSARRSSSAELGSTVSR